MLTTTTWRTSFSRKESQKRITDYRIEGYDDLRIIPKRNSYTVTLCGTNRGTFGTLSEAKHHAEWIFDKLMTV